MRSMMFLAGVLIVSPAAAQEGPTSWMLLLRTDTGVAFAPTTYEKREECEMVAESIYQITLPRRPACLPAHFADHQVAEFEAEQEALIVRARERIRDIEQKRPQLEAEREEILSDRVKRNTLRYMDRLKEIDALIGPVRPD